MRLFAAGLAIILMGCITPQANLDVYSYETKEGAVSYVSSGWGVEGRRQRAEELIKQQCNGSSYTLISQFNNSQYTGSIAQATPNAYGGGVTATSAPTYSTSTTLVFRCVSH